jgi:hypothetical protein
MYCYDAGVLGRVQTTKPYLDALKVYLYARLDWHYADTMNRTRPVLM